MSLTKEYVITEISASSDGSPSIMITLRDPSDVRGPQKMNKPAMVTFTSMNDMMKNFGNVISKQMMGGFATVLKLGLDEYEKLDINVGDKVSLEIFKIVVEYPWRTLL